MAGKAKSTRAASRSSAAVSRAAAPTSSAAAAAAVVVADDPAAAARRRRRSLAALALAGVAVVLFFSSLRMSAPAPWSYDEYYHLAMAREMRAHFPLRAFPWTPFSLVSQQFADGSPLFHIALMPVAGLSIENAGLLGALGGQIFVAVCLAVALWRLRLRHAWLFVLGLATLGSLVALRLDMCRPQLLLIGFSLLTVGLLVTEAPGWVLALVTAFFALGHAGSWIALFYAAVWAVAGWPLGSRRILWRPLLWIAAGWIAGQIVHPNFPHNLRLMEMTNLVVPFEASPAGDAALRSQIGEELSPPGLGILMEEWTVFVAPLLVAWALWRDRRLRTRATLTTALVSVGFLVLGALLMRRMLELGAPLALLALAAVTAERQRQGLRPLFGEWSAMTAGIALLLGALWTSTTLRSHGYGELSPPQQMAAWLGEHGKAGERVFTAQWADSAPLLYSAPQLQSLVALDPTMFYLKDPKLFQQYVEIVQGRRADATAAIRQQFGARWVTIWRAPLYAAFDGRILADPSARIVYRDANYVIVDLGGR